MSPCHPSLTAFARALDTYGDWESRLAVASGLFAIPKNEKKMGIF
jgi:hypothetical protein